MDRKKLFATNFRRLLKQSRQKGVTVESLAAKLGCSASLLWKWCNKGVEFPTPFVQKAASELGVTVEQLWGEVEVPAREAQPTPQVTGESQNLSDDAILAKARLLLQSESREAVRHAVELIWDRFGK